MNNNPIPNKDIKIIIIIICVLKKPYCKYRMHYKWLQLAHRLLFVNVQYLN
jgi:hypothetical protein